MTKFIYENVRVYKRRRMPHWDVAEGLYSVTYHLADALPAAVRERFELERRRSLEEIERLRGTISPAEFRRASEAVREKAEDYLDRGFGACWMKRPEVAQIVAGAITFFDLERYTLFAWTVMPSHVHVVFAAQAGFSLARILHSWKGFSANKANQALDRGGTFWQEEFFDRTIRDDAHLRRAIAYVASNPAKAGLVDWPWIRTYEERTV